MSDAAKILEARKAAALEAGKRAQEAAEREAAEIDRDLQELARINKKYGLTSEAVASEQQRETSSIPAMNAAATAGQPLLMTESAVSMTMLSRLESAAVIRELNRPVPLGELHQKICARGVRLGGKNPAWVLSSILGRTEGFRSLRERGWWLTHLGDPPSVKPIDLLGHSSPNEVGRSN